MAGGRVNVVRGKVVGFAVAIAEYEEAYRRFLRDRPELVALLTTGGNVYDDPPNVFDDDYDQPHTAMNHYQDISVRRVIAELADDPEWPEVADGGGRSRLIDLRTGADASAPRAKGFRGRGCCRSASRFARLRVEPGAGARARPAAHHHAAHPQDWYHVEGSAHLSVEAFWQMSKVIEVRYDRFLALAEFRDDPLSGL